MVNDVLQKHRAFWHPGRGSPYQLNLGEGRARREFPSSRHGRSSYDSDGLYYPNKKKKSKHIHSRQLRKPVAETTNLSPVNHTENLPEHIVPKLGPREDGLSILNNLQLSNPANGMIQPNFLVPGEYADASRENKRYMGLLDSGDKQRSDQQNAFEQNIDPALLSLSMTMSSDKKENTIVDPQQLLLGSEESRTLNSLTQDSSSLPR